ncbi:MAG TPA: hypothetical protein VHT72_10135, partial [Puia sp.]|nr:hypothetical protein [Puia sp.]
NVSPFCRNNPFSYTLYKAHFHFIRSLRNFKAVNTIGKFVKAFPIQELLAKIKLFLHNAADRAAVVL